MRISAFLIIEAWFWVIRPFNTKGFEQATQEAPAAPVPEPSAPEPKEPEAEAASAPAEAPAEAAPAEAPAAAAEPAEAGLRPKRGMPRSPSSANFSRFFFGGRFGSPIKIDKRKKTGTLILTSLSLWRT